MATSSTRPSSILPSRDSRPRSACANVAQAGRRAERVRAGEAAEMIHAPSLRCGLYCKKTPGSHPLDAKEARSTCPQLSRRHAELQSALPNRSAYRSVIARFLLGGVRLYRRMCSMSRCAEISRCELKSMYKSLPTKKPGTATGSLSIGRTLTFFFLISLMESYFYFFLHPFRSYRGTRKDHDQEVNGIIASRSFLMGFTDFHLGFV